MFTATIFITFFSLFIPQLKDASPTVAAYYDFYKEVDKGLKKKDKEERATIKEDFKQLKKRAFKTHRKTKKIAKEFWEIDGNYNATIDEYYAALDEVELLLDTLLNHTLEARGLLVDNLSKEEWKVAHSALEKSYEKTVEKHEKWLEKKLSKQKRNNEIE